MPRRRFGKKLFKSFLPILLVLVLAFVVALASIVHGITRPPRQAYLVTPQSFSQISGSALKVTDEHWRNRDGTPARGWSPRCCGCSALSMPPARHGLRRLGPAPRRTSLRAADFPTGCPGLIAPDGDRVQELCGGVAGVTRSSAARSPQRLPLGCPGWDSNPHWIAFEATGSAGWPTRAQQDPIEAGRDGPTSRLRSRNDNDAAPVRCQGSIAAPAWLVCPGGGGRRPP